MGVGSSSVSFGQVVGETMSADVVVVEALVWAGDLLLELVVAVFWECCECSARISGFCSTSDLTSRGSASLCNCSLRSSVAECSASLESEMLFLSELGVLGAVSLPAEILERVVVLVALLRRRKRGRNRRDLILLIPASSRWP